MLLANKLKQFEFVRVCQRFKSRHNWCLQVFNLLGLILVAHATNVISKPFPWLLLNRSHETCLALQCIEVVVCRTAFFHKSTFISKAVNWNPTKKSFQETFGINNRYCHYCYFTFIDCRQKKVSHNLDEKSQLQSAKKEEKSYICIKT